MNHDDDIPAPHAPATVPDPGEGKRGTGGYLGYLLRQAATAHGHRMDAALAGLGLTAPQFGVLTMLNAYPGASGADLARTALVTPQTVSVILSNLERAGLVARRAHAVHGRIRQAELTAEGRARLAAARTRVHALEPELGAGLSPQEEAAVRRWLVAVARLSS